MGFDFVKGRNEPCLGGSFLRMLADAEKGGWLDGLGSESQQSAERGRGCRRRRGRRWADWNLAAEACGNLDAEACGKLAADAWCVIEACCRVPTEREEREREREREKGFRVQTDREGPSSASSACRRRHRMRPEAACRRRPSAWISVTHGLEGRRTRAGGEETDAFAWRGRGRGGGRARAGRERVRARAHGLEGRRMAGWRGGDRRVRVERERERRREARAGRERVRARAGKRMGLFRVWDGSGWDGFGDYFAKSSSGFTDAPDQARCRWMVVDHVRTLGGSSHMRI